MLFDKNPDKRLDFNALWYYNFFLNKSFTYIPPRKHIDWKPKAAKDAFYNTLILFCQSPTEKTLKQKHEIALMLLNIPENHAKLVEIKPFLFDFYKQKVLSLLRAYKDKVENRKGFHPIDNSFKTENAQLLQGWLCKLEGLDNQTSLAQLNEKINNCCEELEKAKEQSKLGVNNILEPLRETLESLQVEITKFPQTLLNNKTSEVASAETKHDSSHLPNNTTNVSMQTQSTGNPSSVNNSEHNPQPTAPEVEVENKKRPFVQTPNIYPNPSEIHNTIKTTQNPKSPEVKIQDVVGQTFHGENNNQPLQTEEKNTTDSALSTNDFNNLVDQCPGVSKLNNSNQQKTQGGEENKKLKSRIPVLDGQQIKMKR